MGNIAFGVITNNIDSFSPYCDFILNARKYGHDIQKLIICYSNKIDENVVKMLREYIDLELLKINKNEKLKKQLLNIGLSKTE
ncbi:MAG: hypothetical protein KGY44_06545, partial [Halanaerobiales bacterium]|nr:hypothetical protein [Halanaerobiales bacterium]